ncbi:MAG: trigger factor [Eubacterium sp.]|nr:trigger factor [Eubacterium sp.]
MSVQIEKKEHNMATLTIEVAPERLAEAMMNSYKKQKNHINIAGFRKGKVPYAMVEKMYGPSIFYDDAANELINTEYPTAADECGEEIVSMPEINIVQIEKGKPFIFTAEVALKPEVKLGKYMGVTVTRIDVNVTDEDVNEALETERNNNSRLVAVEDRPAADGDTVILDFDGYVDGEQFEGGKAEGYTLVLGSGSFIPGFEDQLIGHNVEEDIDVNVTFPKNYQQTELAGKDALFKCKLHEIKVKELPELDDEFAQDVSEFDTLEEYKNKLREDLTKKKEDDARYTKQEEALKKIIDKSEMDIPDAMVKSQVDNLLGDMANNLAQQGISMDMYYQITNTSEETLREQYKEHALSQIQNTLVLEAVAKEENIEVTDADVDEELKNMAAQYGMDEKTLLEIAKPEDRESLRRDKMIQKAAELIVDNVKERAKPKSKKEKEAEAAAKED